MTKNYHWKRTCYPPEQRRGPTNLVGRERKGELGKRPAIGREGRVQREKTLETPKNGPAGGPVFCQR